MHTQCTENVTYSSMTFCLEGGSRKGRSRKGGAGRTGGEGGREGGRGGRGEGRREGSGGGGLYACSQFKRGTSS